jgi:hypothetical protein
MEGRFYARTGGAVMRGITTFFDPMKLHRAFQSQPLHLLVMKSAIAVFESVQPVLINRFSLLSNS